MEDILYRYNPWWDNKCSFGCIEFVTDYKNHSSS